jgi:hypothetical protein
MLFIIGLVLAYSFNVDAIAIAKLLAKNEKVRTQFVEFSLARYEEIYEKGKTATSSDSTVAAEDVKKAREEVKTAMEESNAILGLGRKDFFNTKELSHHQTSNGLAFLGWVLTAFAISLGAPFWFDMLNKVAVIRSSVKPKAPPVPDEKAPDQSANPK